MPVEILRGNVSLFSKLNRHYCWIGRERGLWFCEADLRGNDTPEKLDMNESGGYVCTIIFLISKVSNLPYLYTKCSFSRK